MGGPSTGSDSGISATPNLTPLLDVVLQLLMFFIICTNFKMEETSTEIKLPSAQSARPIEKSDVDVLFLNIDPDGKVLVLGKSPMSLIEAKYWLKQQYEDAERLAKGEKVQTAVIVRASRDCDYDNVYKLMQACHDVGFRRLNMRVLQISQEQS